MRIKIDIHFPHFYQTKRGTCILLDLKNSSLIWSTLIDLGTQMWFLSPSSPHEQEEVRRMTPCRLVWLSLWYWLGAGDVWNGATLLDFAITLCWGQGLNVLKGSLHLWRGEDKNLMLFSFKKKKEASQNSYKYVRYILESHPLPSPSLTHSPLTRTAGGSPKRSRSEVTLLII